MDDRIAVDPGVDEDLEAAVEGSTFIFGPDGWESVRRRRPDGRMEFSVRRIVRLARRDDTQLADRWTRAGLTGAEPCSLGLGLGMPIRGAVPHRTVS